MANAFNLTAQLQLQAPTNTSQIANQISKDLNGITVDVQVKTNPRQMAAANSQMQGLSKATQQSANNMGNLNRSLSEAARRFSVITIATGSLLALTRSIKNAFGEAIEFERQLIKVEQVTGRSVKQLSGLTKEITKLSTSLGASSKDLLGISRILTQAGFSVTKVKEALDILAKTTLGATFEDIEDTTEGAIAALRQFSDEARRAGGDIKFLEKTMDAINSVSKNFAVESGDLITVIRRVGGVFESAGGSVNELIALFTSVRSTTRETAETISTGLRTIFTRLQRTDTVDQLKELGIELRNSKGQFVGAFEAVNRLSVGLSALDPKDYRFSEIVESLGGFRQIGKVIPLIKQFTVAQDALRVAQQSGGSVAKDAATAQQSLSVQFDKTREKFDALVRNLADSASFQTMARVVLKLADAFTEMVGALEPLLPLLLPLMGLKLGRALAPGIGALAGATRFARRNEGGPIRKFATGGVVPGTGNRDTVPAMLTPGEFVIRKSSVKKLGAEKLAQMNNNRYAKGGTIQAAKFNKVVDGDSLNISATPTGEPFNTSSRLMGYDAYELNKGTKKERALGQKAKKMAEQHYGNKKSVFKYFKGYGKDKFGRPMYKDDEFGEKMMRTRPDPVAVKYSGTGSRATGSAQALKNKKAKALGGMIQKYAAGGAVQSILKTNLVGSATLDSGKNQDLSMGSISVGQVKGSRYLKGNNFAQNSGAISKYLKSEGKSAVPSYTLKRGSLNQATSNKFSDELLTQIGSAVDGASKMLGKDLIGKPVSASGSAKAAIRSKFSSEGGVVGDLFEATLNTISNSGGFAPANIQQPFDFPNGLSGPAANNFGGTLPSSFVDARKRQSEKPSEDKNSFRRKIINQLGLEVAGSSFAKSSSKTKKLANGGDAGTDTDTVPALLTPGEFVINKDAARRIGQANLDSMNKKGVARFAKGGSVGGVKRFHEGGGVGSSLSSQNNLNDFDISAAEAAIREALEALGLELGRLDSAVETATLNMIDGASAVQAFAEEQKKFKADQLQDDTAVSMGGMGNPANQARRADQTEKSKTDAVLRKKLADRQELLIKSFGRQIKQANAGISKEEALSRAREVVRNQYGELASSIQDGIEATEGLAEAERKAKAETELKANAAGVQKAGQSSLGELQSISGIASSAQQFVFLGAMAGGLATQFTALSDTTKKAINQTLGFVAGMIGGIGTIADLVVSITSSIITRRIEAAAIRESTRLRIAEAAASGEVFEEMRGGSGKITKFAAVLGAAALVVTIAGATFKYMSSVLESEAAEMGKISDAFIEELNKGRNVGGGLAANEQAKIRKEVQKRLTDDAGVFSMVISGVTAVAVGLAAGLGVVATAVGLIPAVIIGLLAGLAVLGLSLLGFKLNLGSATDAEIKRTAAVNESIEAFAILTSEQARLSEALKTIDSIDGLTERQRLDQKIEEQKKSSLGTPEEESRTAAAREKLRKLALEKNKPVGKLIESDFDGEEENKRILKFNKDYLDGLAKALEAQLDNARSNLQTANKLGREGGIESFNDAMKDPFIKSSVISEVNSRYAVTDAKAARIQDQIDSEFNVSMNPNSTPKMKKDARESIVTLREEKTQVQKDGALEIELFWSGQQQMWKAIGEAGEAQRASARASEAAALKLEAIADFGNTLDNFGREVEQRKRDRSDFSSLSKGGTQDFSFTAPLGLKDLKRTGDMQQFENELEMMRMDMPNDGQTQAKSGIESIMLGASLLQEGQPLAKKFNAPTASGNPKQIFDDFLDDMFKTETGGGAAKAKGDDFYDQMRNQFEKAIEEGGISAKEFNEIFKPYINEANAASEQFSKFNKLRNMDLDSYAKYIDTLYSVRNKELQIRGESIALGQKAESFQRQARGLDQTALSKRSDSLALSRNRLSGIGGEMAGKAKAGNLGSIIGARTEAQQRLKDSVDRMTNTNEEVQKKKELALQASLQNAIKITTEELGHFADTTEEAIKSTLERIDQERATRATQKGVLEEAVVGGGAERRSLARAMFNVQKAFATGTVQNQSPEDRQATFAMLDRFGDVFLPGAGMTGDQLKELLIRSDARRMGLSEEAAMAIFNKTPVEEQLIDSVDRLADVMNDVANAMMTNVGMAGFNVQGQGGGGNLQFMAGPPPDNKMGVNAPGVGGFFGKILNLLGLGFATGGKVPVYRNEGGSIFQPKGTDTVPAMLTPGEFVVRKSAVDKVGVGALHAINQGQPLYRANGGPVYLNQGSSGKIKLNPYDEGDKTRAGDRETMDARYESAMASSKEHEFYQRPDTPQEIERQGGITSVRNSLGLSKSPELNLLLDVAASPISLGQMVTDPSFMESPENRASRLFGDEYDQVKKTSDEAQAVSNPMNESRTEADKLDYSAQILAAGGSGKRPSEVGKLFKTDKVFQDGFKGIFTSANTGIGGAMLGLIDAPSRVPEVGDIAFDKAFTKDMVNDTKYLQNELYELNAMYKANGKYRGINFSERIRDDVKARRYNDIKSSIENRITILKKAVAYDQSEKTKADNKAEATQAAKTRGVTLEQYYQQERDKIKLEEAGYSAEQASEYSGARDDMDSGYNRGNSINNDVFKSNLQYAKLWKDSTGQPYDNPNENSGYTDAVAMAIQIAESKWEENASFGGRTYAHDSKFRSPGGETKNLGGKAVSWDDAPFKQKLSAAMNEMHTIGSLKKHHGSDFELKPYHRGIENPNSLQDWEARKQDSMAKLDEEMARTQRSLDAVKQGEKQEASAKQFMENASSVAKNAVSGFASFINVGSERSKKIDAGRVKASKMFSDLKAKGLSSDEAMGKTMASLRFEGFSIEEIDSMIQRPVGPLTKAGQENYDAARDEKMKMMIDDINLPASFGPKDPVSSEYGKQQKKKNRVNQKRQEAEGEKARLAAIMTQAERELGLTYVDPNQTGTSNTPEQKSINKKIRAKYHELRKQAREADQAKSVKKPLPQNSAINPNAAKSAQQVPIGQIDQAIADLTSSDINIDRDRFSPNQKRKLGRAGVNFDAVDAKNQVMLELFQGGWEKQNVRQRKQSLYAKDPGFRSVVGTPQEDWYLGVANQQVMNYGQQLGMRLGAGQGITGLADVYRATGGSINGGMDSVPAMLTPGEFVMSREAVAKHGVGYMKNLNMGKATGFRRGGVVGTGNVQYKANGGEINGSGGMMIDPSLLSGVLDTFSQSFSASIDRIAGPMSNLAASLENIANAFSGLTMTHVFSGQIGLAVNVSNKDAIIAAVSEGITPMISELITRQLDAQRNNFNAGG